MRYGISNCMRDNIELASITYTERIWNHHGLHLCTYTWGTASQNRPTLIFLHGWLDHGDSWNTVGTLLAANGYHCMALDHRGHGHSEHIPLYEEYHFPDYISDLQAFIQAHRLTNFVLIGHSMGGTIASIYSALCPSKPSQCILIDGLGPKHETEVEATHRFKLHLSQRFKQSKHRPMTLETTIKKLSRAHAFLSEDSLRQQALRLTKTIDNADMRQWRWDPRHRNKSAISFSLPRFLDILSQIEIPTHCIFGKNSWYLQLPDIPSRLKAIRPLQNQIQLLCGHSPHVECPDLLVEAIQECLGSNFTA
jgi:pimeloyl-ACP methyl ester carboxylesterase